MQTQIKSTSCKKKSMYSSNVMGRLVLLQDLLCGHHETAPVPGGFGAAGGPNDGWHGVMHQLTRAFLRTAVGWGSAPDLRKRLDELEMNVQSNPSTKTLVNQHFLYV